MSFLRCCVGADPQPAPEAIRSVSTPYHRRSGPKPNASSPFARPTDPKPVNKNTNKLKMPTEVFFDPSKPDGQLSSVTDPPNSMREYVDAKKRKEGKYRTGQQREERKEPTVAGEDRPDLEAPDNNGLTRGQNFMKVEKWLRNSCMYKQIDITPGDITNIEDIPIEMSENTADPPSEKDRLPPPISNQQHVSTTTKSR